MKMFSSILKNCFLVFLIISILYPEKYAVNALNCIVGTSSGAVSTSCPNTNDLFCGRVSYLVSTGLTVTEYKCVSSLSGSTSPSQIVTTFPSTGVKNVNMFVCDTMNCNGAYSFSGSMFLTVLSMLLTAFLASK